jgi:hypothetical protein
MYTGAAAAYHSGEPREADTAASPFSKEADMTLSEGLSTLSGRVKEAEDHAAAARGKARSDLERDVAAARESADAQADELRRRAEAGKGKVSVWWHDLEHSWNEHIAKIRDDIDARRAQHDLERAERRANTAENDAGIAIDFASAAIAEAEYSILNATLARKEADELAQQTAKV